MYSSITFNNNNSEFEFLLRKYIVHQNEMFFYCNQSISTAVWQEKYLT